MIKVACIKNVADWS